MKSKFIFILLICFILTGCSDKTELASITTSPSSTMTPTMTAPRATSTATTIWTPTTTITLLPTLTSTPILPTATWTPIPTINSTDGYNLLMSYYQDNGGCQLPCWWGITPGITTWEEARSRLSPIDQESGPWEITGLPRYNYSFKVPKNDDPLHLGFTETRLWIDRDTVYAIVINTVWIQEGERYSLSSTLKEFGQPDEVWIDLQTDVQDKPHYEMDLFYPQLGLMFTSTGNGEFVDSGVDICPQEFKLDQWPAVVTLFPQSSNISFVEIQNLLFDWSHRTFNFVRLSSITDGFDETVFYQTYQDPSTSACFQTKE